MLYKGKHKSKLPISSTLKTSSSLCALCGAILLACKTIISRYGFIFLAISSSRLLVASILLKDKIMIFYAGCIFIFVDCLGVYRWLLN